MGVFKKAARAQQQKVGKTIPEQTGRRSMTRDAGRPTAAQAAWVHLPGSDGHGRALTCGSALAQTSCSK